MEAGSQRRVMRSEKRFLQSTGKTSLLGWNEERGKEKTEDR